MSATFDFTDHDEGGQFDRLGELTFHVEVSEPEPAVNWAGSVVITGVSRSDGKPVSRRTLAAMRRNAVYWSYLDCKAADEADEYAANSAAAYDDWKTEQSRGHYGF